MNCCGCDYDSRTKEGYSFCKYYQNTKREMDSGKDVKYTAFRHGQCMHDTRANVAQYGQGVQNRIITNADRIRAMSDEELAELLHSQFVFSNSYLPIKWWVDWLKQEVET